jgi:hypothetical protein
MLAVMQHGAWRDACRGSCRLGTRRAPLSWGTEAPDWHAALHEIDFALVAIDRGKNHDVVLKTDVPLQSKEMSLGLIVA